MAYRTKSGLTRETGDALQVVGLKELSHAFKRVDGDLSKALRVAEREIAEPIRERAVANITHTTGRHGDPSLKPLGDTIKIGVTARAVSIYSTQPYSAVQDIGGIVGYGALIPRANASHYMTKAVAQSQATTAAALETLGDRIAEEYER